MTIVLDSQEEFDRIDVRLFERAHLVLLKDDEEFAVIKNRRNTLEPSSIPKLNLAAKILNDYNYRDLIRDNDISKELLKL